MKAQQIPDSIQGEFSMGYDTLRVTAKALSILCGVPISFIQDLADELDSGTLIKALDAYSIISQIDSPQAHTLLVELNQSGGFQEWAMPRLGWTRTVRGWRYLEAQYDDN